jgi:hypothetical protein
MCVQLASAVQKHVLQQLGSECTSSTSFMLLQQPVQTRTHVLPACQPNSHAWPVGLWQTTWHQGHPGKQGVICQGSRVMRAHVNFSLPPWATTHSPSLYFTIAKCYRSPDDNGCRPAPVDHRSYPLMFEAAELLHGNSASYTYGFYMEITLEISTRIT